jgi:LTXXQ motif family protein
MEATMKTRITLAAVLVLAACGGPRPANGPGPAGSGRDLGRDSVERAMFSAMRTAQMPSVYALIGARERLKLTSAQVTALDSIAEAVREQNRPLTDSLRRFSRSGNGGPIRLPGNEAQQRDFTVILRQMGENSRRGLASIQALLTPEQRTGVCQIAREQGGFGYGRMERRGGFGGEGGGSGRGGGMYGGGRGGMPPEMRGDSLDLRAGAGGWPWCGPTRGPRGMRGDSARADSGRVRRP